MRDFRFCYALQEVIDCALKTAIAFLSDDNAISLQNRFETISAFPLSMFTFPQDYKRKRKEKFQMEVEKKLKIGLLLSAVVNLPILCRDYCILLEPINNIITESKKNIIIFVSFKINPITFRFSLANPPTPQRNFSRSMSLF